MILDTTFVIGLIAEDQDAKTKLDELHDTGALVRVSVLTAYEVKVGLRGMDEHERYDCVTGLMLVSSPQPDHLTESRRHPAGPPLTW